MLLVGAGGIGNPAALALAAAGAGLVRVLDDDLVEGPNLHRQVLFGEGDVGRSKAEALADAVRARVPGARVEPVLARALPETALGLVREVDVVLDGTDNFASRFLLADAAFLAGRPVVHAASVRWEGTCFVSAAGGRPCYRCLFEDLPEGPAPDCASAGVVGPVCGVIGGVAADAALRVGGGRSGARGHGDQPRRAAGRASAHWGRGARLVPALRRGGEHSVGRAGALRRAGVRGVKGASMGVDDVRYQRQIVLREVGYEGQARLGASAARVPGGGLAGEVAVLYARRAGFGEVVVGGEAPAAPSWVESAAAAEVVAGSLAALRAFAAVVLGGVEGGGDGG